MSAPHLATSRFMENVTRSGLLMSHLVNWAVWANIVNCTIEWVNRHGNEGTTDPRLPDKESRRRTERAGQTDDRRKQRYEGYAERNLDDQVASPQGAGPASVGTGAGKRAIERSRQIQAATTGKCKDCCTGPHPDHTRTWAGSDQPCRAGWETQGRNCRHRQ